MNVESVNALGLADVPILDEAVLAPRDDEAIARVIFDSQLDAFHSLEVFLVLMTLQLLLYNSTVHKCENR